MLGLLLMGLPGAVRADGIEVISDQQRINFPRDVSFNLVVRSDLDIVEVRLDYRTRGSRIWTYGYSSFSDGGDGGDGSDISESNNGRRITAAFILPTDGAGYVPPGTAMEYYYTIRDTSGARLRTSTKIFEYSDPRFDWEETRVGPLTLLYHDRSRSKVDDVVQDVDLDLHFISNLLQVDLDRPVKGIIYNSREEAEEVFPIQSRTTAELRMFQGFAFPSRDVFVGIGLDRGLIAHESAHLLMHQAASRGNRAVPSWLDEGFASYVEPGAAPYSGQSISPHGIPLRSMHTVSGDPHAIRVFYLKAESVVTYLIDEHGQEAFQRFISAYTGGHTIDGALETTYGFDLDGLETRWAASDAGARLPASGREPATLPSPLLYFDTWLIGGLGLAVLVIVLARHALRKLHPAQKHYDSESYEEGLQPWEDPDRQ